MQRVFDNIRIDTQTFKLSRAGKPCPLEPKVFDLLRYLVEHPGQVFTHDELIAAVWPGRVVSESTVSTCIKNARKALGDDGSQQRYIKTVRGRGFLFDADVRSEHAEPSSARPVDSSEYAPPGLLIRAFRVLDDAASSRQLSSAMVSDIARILSRIPLLRITLQDGLPEAGEVGPTPREWHETLGVDFVLEGSLQVVEGRYRLMPQLLDARSGFQLWSDRLEVSGPLPVAFDEAAIAVIAKLEPQLQKAIYTNLKTHDGSASAQQLFLQAASVMVLSGWGHSAFSEAAELLRRSIFLAPDFALAQAFLSLVMGFGDRVGLMADRDQAKAEAEQAAEQALALDSLDSTVLGYAGCALADIEQRERAQPILESAIELNPANAQAWAALGSVHVLEGRTEKGIEYLSHGLAISPLDSRLSIWGAILAMGYVQAGRLEEALSEAQLACRRDHRCYLPRVAMAGIHWLRGEQEPARTCLGEARRINPKLSKLQIQSIVGRKLAVGLSRLAG